MLYYVSTLKRWNGIKILKPWSDPDHWLKIFGRQRATFNSTQYPNHISKLLSTKNLRCQLTIMRKVPCSHTSYHKECLSLVSSSERGTVLQPYCKVNIELDSINRPLIVTVEIASKPNQSNPSAWLMTYCHRGSEVLGAFLSVKT